MASDLLIALASVASAAGGLVAHRNGSVRGRLGHLLAATSMIIMAVPGLDPLNPLLWCLLLCAAAFWVAGGGDPVLKRLFVLQDLFVMACLMFLMPLAAHAGAPAPSGHHAALAATSAGSLHLGPAALVALWMAGRIALWATLRRTTAGPPRAALLTTEGGMAAAMALMVL